MSTCKRRRSHIPTALAADPTVVATAVYAFSLGLTEPGDLVAAAWQPPADFGGRRGEHLPLEFVWSALDCPGAWARRRIVQSDRRALTAYLAAAITRPVRVDEPHVVIGWLQSASGRKSLVGSAIVNKHQEVCAIAEALWVERSLSQASPGHDLTAANHVDDSSLTIGRNPDRKSTRLNSSHLGIS